MVFRHRLLVAVPAIALACAASSALAAGNASANTTASVTLLSPVRLTATQPLDFGSVVRPSSGTTTVTLNANNVVSVSGGDGTVLAGSTPTSAKFNLVGDAGLTYSTVQALSFTPDNLTAVAASAPTATTGAVGTLPGSGTVTQELRFGGSFAMDVNTPTQTYNGTLSVTVNYN